MDVKREWFDTDYYKVLGVSPTANEKEIQTAYRKLARELHPDRNPGDTVAEERFKEVASAYDVISDAETRQQYDQARRMGAAGNPFEGGGGRGAPGGGPGGFSFDVGDMGDLGDLLRGMFGGGRGGGSPFNDPRGPRKGRDQEAQLALSFEEIVNGVTTSVTIGDGGGGTRTIKVRIPSGVNDGQRIRLKGKGGGGQNGGPAGDLYVIVRAGTHDRFAREGSNLTLKVPITFPEAALGADIKVPTFEGDPVTVRLPAGTQSGRTFRVKGRGISTTKGDGDLLVEVELAVPQKLNRKQRKALQEFADAGSGESPREDID